MSDILKLQHISTKQAMLNAIKGKYDYDERVEIGTVIHLQGILFEQAVSPEARAELARLRKIEQAAKEMTYRLDMFLSGVYGDNQKLADETKKEILGQLSAALEKE